MRSSLCIEYPQYEDKLSFWAAPETRQSIPSVEQDQGHESIWKKKTEVQANKENIDNDNDHDNIYLFKRKLFLCHNIDEIRSIWILLISSLENLNTYAIMLRYQIVEVNLILRVILI